MPTETGLIQELTLEVEELEGKVRDLTAGQDEAESDLAEAWQEITDLKIELECRQCTNQITVPDLCDHCIQTLARFNAQEVRYGT